MSAPTPTRKSFLQEYGNLGTTLIIVALIAGLFYYLALSKERSQQSSQVQLIHEIQSSTVSPAELVPRVESEIRKLHEDEFWIGILHHVSTALIISFVVIVTVELHTRRLTRRDFEDHLQAINHTVDEHMEEIKQNVWQALGKRLVGDRIASELEAVMKEQAAKEHCVYVLTFTRAPEDVAKNRIVVKIENSYKLRNLNDAKGQNYKYPVRCNISGYEKIGIYPRYTRFKDGVQDEKPPTVDPKNPNILKREILLPQTSNERVDIALGMEVLYQFKDSESFITEVPIEGLTVMVFNLIPDLITQPEIFLLHRCDEMEHPNESMWVFDKAVLPGQGFVITWNPVPLFLETSNGKSSINFEEKEEQLEFGHTPQPPPKA